MAKQTVVKLDSRTSSVPSSGAVDLMAFRLDFERLLERHGVRLDFSQVPTLAMLPALLGLTLVAHGATVDMPQSTHELYRELRAALEATR